MNVTRRLVRLFRDEGAYHAMKIILRHIHQKLPKRKREYVGVKVKDGILFDPILPWKSDSNPHHESGIISGINEQVEQGDDVVIVGGGKGVTAVIAAQKVGEDGSVEVYEGGYKGVQKSKQTIRMNDVEDIINVNHSIVGPAIKISGSERNATNVQPNELPDCDVLELDCEGAELSILDDLDQSPRVILVESHGVYDSPSEEVINSLNKRGYNVVSKEVANRGMEQIHTENDVYAITAVRNDNSKNN